MKTAHPRRSAAGFQARSLRRRPPRRQRPRAWDAHGRRRGAYPFTFQGLIAWRPHFTVTSGKGLEELIQRAGIQGHVHQVLEIGKRQALQRALHGRRGRIAKAVAQHAQ